MSIECVKPCTNPRVAMSSAAFAPIGLKIIERLFLSHVPPSVQMEQMIFRPNELEKALHHPSREVAGVHYKPKSYKEKEIGGMIKDIYAIVRDEKMNGKYLTLHGDDLFLAICALNKPNGREVSQELWVKHLIRIARIAAHNEVTIAVENSTNPNKTSVPIFTYRLREMVKVLRPAMDTHTNLRFCLDMSHLMEDDIYGYLVLQKVFKNLEISFPMDHRFNKDVINEMHILQYAITHAHTIHFSRAKEHQKDKFNPVYILHRLGFSHMITAALWNMTHAHYTGSSDPEFWEMTTKFFKILGFTGTDVVESLAPRQPKSFIEDVRRLVKM